MGSVGAKKSGGEIEIPVGERKKEVTYEEVKEIQNTTYIQDIGALSNEDKETLRMLIYSAVILNGQTAANAMWQADKVQSIIDGTAEDNYVSIKLGDFTSDELKLISKLMEKSPYNKSIRKDIDKLRKYYAM